MVTLSDVTHASVLAAVAEFDRLGRAAFLSSTEFHPAKAYFLEYDGKLYEAYAKVSLKKYKPMAARNEDKNVPSGLL